MITISAQTSSAGSVVVNIDAGTEPITCRLQNAPSGVTIDSARRISWPSGLSAGQYNFQVICANCGGDSDPMPVVMDVTGVVIPVDCESASPPGAVARWFAQPTSPVLVPEDFMGLHVHQRIPAWGGGGNVPEPAYPFKAVRSLAATGLNGSGVVVEECGFWTTIEDGSGNYDWSAMDDWQNTAVKGRPYVHVMYGPPDRYCKYPGEGSRWPSYANAASPPNDAGLAALTAFATALRQRYPNLMAFEILNEPTFNWNVPVTEYGPAARADPAFMASYLGGSAPFFNGSPTDLANMTAAVKAGSGGLPVWIAAWENASANNVTRSVNAPSNYGSYSGQTAGQIADAISGHFYDFSSNMIGDMIAALDEYKNNAGSYGSLPLYMSEGGIWNANRPDTDMELWYLIPAIMGWAGAYGYGHMWMDEAHMHYGTPNSPLMITRMNKLDKLNGATICNAALLQDGSVWAVLSDGTTWHLSD